MVGKNAENRHASCRKTPFLACYGRFCPVNGYLWGLCGLVAFSAGVPASAGTAKKLTLAARYGYNRHSVAVSASMGLRGQSARQEGTVQPGGGRSHFEADGAISLGFL